MDTARIHSEVIRIQTDEHQLDEVVVTEKYPTRNITPGSEHSVVYMDRSHLQGRENYPFTGTKQMKTLKNMKDYGNGNPQMKTANTVTAPPATDALNMIVLLLLSVI